MTAHMSGWRVTRIMPAYLFAVLFTAGLLALWPLRDGRPEPSHVLLHLTFLQPFLKVPAFDIVYWTLFVELRFYLLFAILVWFGLTRLLDAYLDTRDLSADYPILAWAMHDACYKMQAALDGVLRNFPVRPIAWVLRVLVFPLGRRAEAPGDRLNHRVASLLMAWSYSFETGLVFRPTADRPVAATIDPHDWWHNPAVARVIFTEYLKFLAVWVRTRFEADPENSSVAKIISGGAPIKAQVVAEPLWR